MSGQGRATPGQDFPKFGPHMWGHANVASFTDSAWDGLHLAVYVEGTELLPVHGQQQRAGIHHDIWIFVLT